MEDSILGTIAGQVLGDVDETGFDADLLMFLNSAISDMEFIGYPKPSVDITGREQTWTEFFENVQPDLQKTVREYLYIKVRVMFDPPQSAALLSHFNERIKRLEAQIQATTDY